MKNPVKESYAFQKIIVIVGCILFLVKLSAWYLTKSVSILTDTLESTINILAGLFSLYSLFISSKPKDRDHPYGHGKIEFISAGVEGGLITIAGFIIIFESIKNLFIPHSISKLDYGIVLVTASGFVNYILGVIAIQKGKKNKSLALVSGGEHLKSDTYSTIGLVIGLILIYFTHFFWLDSIIALFFGGIIIYTGIKIIRKSLAGIMDEADEDLIKELVQTLEKKRNDNWIDIHNVRFIKYGSSLHLDSHLTMPWYFNLKESDKELRSLEKIIKDNFGNRFEMFVHVDGCEDYSCQICQKKDCPVRKHPFKQKITWTIENIELNRNHSLENLNL